jgi:hypothetical protein
MADEKPARYEGAYVPRISQDEIDAVYEQASMQPRFDHPAPGKEVPKVSDVTRAARKEAEDKVRLCAATQQPGPPACQIRLPDPPVSCRLTTRVPACTGGAHVWRRLRGKGRWPCGALRSCRAHTTSGLVRPRTLLAPPPRSLPPPAHLAARTSPRLASMPS